jgi:hypothetical protein
MNFKNTLITMKKITLFFSLLLFTGFTVAQTPPLAVEKAFKNKFPNTNKAYWENEDNNQWEAEFRINKKRYTALFSSDGKWINTEGEIELSDFPNTLSKEVIAKYPESTILEVCKIETVTNEIFYEAKIKTKKGKRKIFMKNDGTFVKSMLR